MVLVVVFTREDRKERNRVNDVTISRDLEISCEFVNISSSREPHFGDLNLRSQPRSEFTQSEVRVRAEHKKDAVL